MCIRDRQREINDLEAFVKKENAEMKKESRMINDKIKMDQDKRDGEAAAVREKMEQEKKELQVQDYLFLSGPDNGFIEHHFRNIWSAIRRR